MLQGSSFEAELVVQERVRTVQQGVDPGRRTFKLQFGNVREWLRSLASALGRPRSSVRHLRPVQDRR
jgi:hypothetical protein